MDTGQGGAQGLPGIIGALPAANVSVGPLQWNEKRTTALAYLAFDPELNLEERRDAAERFVERLEPAPGARAGQTGPAPARLAQYDAIVGALPFITLGSILLIALIVGAALPLLDRPAGHARRGRRSPTGSRCTSSAGRASRPAW